MESLNLEHKEVLDSLGSVQIPEKVQTKLNTLNGMIEEYQTAPTDKLKTDVEHLSAKLTHDLLDLKEADLPDDDGKEVVTAPPVETPVTQTEPVVDTPPAPPAPVTEPAAAAEEEDDLGIFN